MSCPTHCCNGKYCISVPCRSFVGVAKYSLQIVMLLQRTLYVNVTLPPPPSLPLLSLVSHSLLPSPYLNYLSHMPQINDGCRKRPYESEEGEETRGVYDLPYIGQHQQGIPYLHPLKRIRIGVMSSKEILQ